MNVTMPRSRPLRQRSRPSRPPWRTAFDAADKAVQAALTAVEKASNRAEEASDKRFESVNEYQGQLANQAANSISRAEYSVQHKALDDKVTSIADRVVQLELRLTSRLGPGQGQRRWIQAVRRRQAARFRSHSTVGSHGPDRNRGDICIDRDSPAETLCTSQIRYLRVRGQPLTMDKDMELSSMSTLFMFDDVDVNLLPANADAYAGHPGR